MVIDTIDRLLSLKESNFYADTGSLLLNFVVSRDMLKGLPIGVNVVAGWVGAGKTTFLLNVLRRQLIKASRNPQISIGCYYYDTELEGFDFEIGSKVIGLSQKPNNYEIVFRKVAHFDEFSEKILTDVNKTTYDANIFILDSFATLTSKQVKELEKEREKVIKKDEVYELENQQILLKQKQIINLVSEFIDLFEKKQIVFIITTHLYETIGSFITKEEIKGGNYIKYIAKNVLVVDKAKKKDVIHKIIKNSYTLSFSFNIRKNRLGFENSEVKIVGLPLIYDPVSGLIDYITIDMDMTSFETQDVVGDLVHPLPILYKKGKKYYILQNLVDDFKKVFPDVVPEMTADNWNNFILSNIKEFSNFLKAQKEKMDLAFEKEIDIINY